MWNVALCMKRVWICGADSWLFWLKGMAHILPLSLWRLERKHLFFGWGNIVEFLEGPFGYSLVIGSWTCSAHCEVRGNFDSCIMALNMEKTLLDSSIAARSVEHPPAVFVCVSRCSHLYLVVWSMRCVTFWVSGNGWLSWIVVYPLYIIECSMVSVTFWTIGKGWLSWIDAMPLF